MEGYSIGLNGLIVAQRAIELIGTNIANAGTPGYHRQELKISPLELRHPDGNIQPAGPRVDGVERLMDWMLDCEIARQQPAAGQVDQELATLQTIESMLGQLSSEGLGSAMNSFFNSLSELTAQPDSRALREQVIWAAEGLVGHFHSLSQSLTDIGQKVYIEAQTLAERINQLSSEIAELNREVELVTLRAGNANLIKDRRDQAAKELAELADVRIETSGDNPDLINILAWGTYLVAGDRATEIEVDYVEGQTIGVSVKDAIQYDSTARGGKLGGLLSIKNEILPDLQDRLDLLAETLVDQVNGPHVQGVGPAGAFTELTGTFSDGGTLSGWDAQIQPGTFYIRLIDSAGNVSVQEVAVDPDTDTLETIRDKLNALDPAHLSAEVASNALAIRSLGGWRFDFVAPLGIGQDNLTGPDPAEPSVSGMYSLQTNQVFTCTVVGDGQVGVTDGLSIEVRDGSAQLVRTLNVGTGYAAGDRLAVGYGLELALTAGTLNDGETFTIQAIANSDETGFLAAAGMNTFFAGRSAQTIRVRDSIADDPDGLATARGPNGSDNENAVLLAGLAARELPELGNLSMVGFYRQLVLSVGQGVAFRRARQESMTKVLQHLENQRDAISGVDVNEEAARLLSFQRMFQAMSRFIGVQDKALEYLLTLI